MQACGLMLRSSMHGGWCGALYIRKSFEMVARNKVPEKKHGVSSRSVLLSLSSHPSESLRVQQHIKAKKEKVCVFEQNMKCLKKISHQKKTKQNCCTLITNL